MHVLYTNVLVSSGQGISGLANKQFTFIKKHTNHRTHSHAI